MNEQLMKEKLLFNPKAKEINTMINGDTTNLLNLADIPKDYEIFHKLFDTAYGNNWLPHKVPMSNDKSDYNSKLMPEEVEAYDLILSFLAFLDSIQTNNLPNISNYITNPHVVYFLARQTMDEALHSKSYGWIFNSLMSKEKANRLYNLWKENKTLLERNQFIAKIYQDFVDKPNNKNFMRSIIGNYMLEGLYFYNGFQFFHNLANRGLMLDTDKQISYIQRDEIVHCTAFENIINITFKENKGMRADYKNMIQEMFQEAAEWEIKFSSETIGDKILGMNTKSIIDYTYHLGNSRMEDIGIEGIFPKTENPYKHLAKNGGVEDETSNRTNNFEGKSINYKSPEVVDGWDLI